jgi:hypothetical protein
MFDRLNPFSRVNLPRLLSAAVFLTQTVEAQKNGRDDNNLPRDFQYAEYAVLATLAVIGLVCCYRICSGHQENPNDFQQLPDENINRLHV